MRTTKIVIVLVAIAAWLVAIGSLINGFADVSTFPDPARSILGLWPDPDTGLANAVRFGAIGVVIASVLAFRIVGKVSKDREQSQEQAARPVMSGE